MNNFNNWDLFFDKIDFTFFRTSIIQEKYIGVIYSLFGHIRNESKDKHINLIEVAAGSGYTSAVIADLIKKDTNHTVYMSDLSDNLEERAGHFAGVKCMNSINAFEIKKCDKYYDIMFHQGFLEHFSDEEIVSLLMEGGRVSRFVVFDVPNGIRYNKKQEFGNERFLLPSKWLSLVRKAGLKVKSVHGRRFTNWWYKFLPKFIFDYECVQRLLGESTIIVCHK